MSSKPYIVIGVPLAPDRKADFENGVFCGSFTGIKNVEVIAKPVHETAYGRNLIIIDAMAIPEMTHILFVDADVVPPSETLGALLALNKPVAAGIYTLDLEGKKHWSASVIGSGGSYAWLEHGKEPQQPFQAMAIAGGCMLVRREVLQAVGWPWFEYIYDKNGGRTGEDIFFVNRVKECGFEIWVNPVIKCKHFHTKDIT